MSFVTFVSGRYLKTRRKQAFISLITGLSVAGVTVGVMALIVVIAVMAGFELDLKSRIMGIRPHLVIKKGEKPFSAPEPMVRQLAAIEEIDTISETLTSQVVLRTQTRVTGAIVKGIRTMTENSTVHGVDLRLLAPPDQDPSLTENGQPLPGIVLGKALAATLGVLRGDPIYIISPRGMLSPAGHMPSMLRFRVVDLFESGMYEFDGTLAFVHLAAAQKMLRMPNAIGAIEIRLSDMARTQNVAEAIQRLIDDRYTISDWKEINRNLFSALRLEKTVMFIILTLIVLVATFNIAGSLVMMVMEKQKDIAILKAMGAPSSAVRKIFIIKGLAVGLLGTALGSASGLALCLLLKRYAFVRLPADIYYITTLPVHLRITDVVLIAVCALLICFLATLYPARQAANINPVEAIRHG